MAKFRKRKGREDEDILDLNDMRQDEEDDRRRIRGSGMRSGKAGRSGNREFAVVTYLFLFIFLAWIAYFAYFMFFRADTVINNSYNARTESFSKLVRRGDILDRNGNVLAHTDTTSDGTDVRTYPYGGEFAHVVGYTIQGSEGIESLANFYMLRSHAFLGERLRAQLTGNKMAGDSIRTTLDVPLQEAAYQAIGSFKGAAVAIDPETGEMLAMVSKPDFNPNTLAADWNAITAQDENSSVLLNRATQGLYPPGSVFKIFTTVEYLREHNMDDSSYSFDCTGSFTQGDSTIHCYHNAVHGLESLESSFANSCNSSFANIGLSLDIKSFISLADNCLFNSALPTDFSYKKSSFSLTEDSGTAEIMQTAIGQGQTLVTPFHMALIASAIANDGVLMNPYVISSIRNDDGNTVRSFSASEYGTIFQKDENAKLQEYMQDTVAEGTAQALNGQSYTAYGKTGTAEFTDTENGPSHAWFIGYAEKDGKKIAVAVIVENAGSGSQYAVPVAKSMFDTWAAE